MYLFFNFYIQKAKASREEKENKFVESIQNEMNSIKEKLNKAKQERYNISYFTIFTIGKYLRREFSNI